MKKAESFFFSKAMIVALLLNSFNSSGQLPTKTLRLAFLNETIGLPSVKLTKLPIHPAVNIGTDIRVKAGKHWQRALGADAYYFYHKLSEHAIMLDASYRIGYKFNFGLQLNLLTALGYKHTILSGAKYELQDGEYKKTTHLGKAMVNTKLGVGLEYPISEKYSIMTDYKIMIAGPSGGIYVPFSINTFLGAGLKINLQNK